MSTPNESLAAQALPPDVDPPIPKLNLAAQIALDRLSRASDIVTYEMAFDRHVFRQAVRGMNPGFAAAPHGNLGAAVEDEAYIQELEELDYLRAYRDLAFSDVYAAEGDPRAAFKADLDILNKLALNLGIKKARKINQHRRSMTKSALAQYKEDVEFEDFALAVRDYICIRSRVQIDILYTGDGTYSFKKPVAATVFDDWLGGAAGQMPIPWLPFDQVNSAAEKSDTIASGDISTEDIWRLCSAHPLLVVLPQLYRWAGRAAIALCEEHSGKSLAEIGRLFHQSIGDQLDAELDRLDQVSLNASNSSRGYQFILPSYLDQAARLLAENAPQGVAVNYETILVTAQYCFDQNQPVDAQMVVGLIFGAAAISLAIGGYLVFTAATGGAGGALGFAVLGLMIDLAGLIVDGFYLYEAYKLDQAGGSEALFQAIEPRMVAYEIESHYGFDLAMFLFGCLMLVPAVAEIRHGTKAVRASAELAEDGLSAIDQPAVKAVEGPAELADDLGGAPALPEPVQRPAPIDVEPPPQLQKPATIESELPPTQTAGKPEVEAPPREQPLTYMEAKRQKDAERAAARAQAAKDAARLTDAPEAPPMRDVDREVQELFERTRDSEVEELLNQTPVDDIAQAEKGLPAAASPAAADATRMVDTPATPLANAPLPLDSQIGMLDDIMPHTGTPDLFFPETVRFAGKDLDKLHAGQVWAWIQSTRRGLGRTMTATGQYYRQLLDDIDIVRRVNLRQKRGYLDSLRSDPKLHAYWESQGWARQIVDEDTGFKRWQYAVDDSGKWYERSEIDFGHIVDVVVYDQGAFIIENEIRTMMYAGEIPFSEARIAEVDRALRKLFMDNPHNYIPELKSLNRSNGGIVGLSYRDQVTFRTAFDQMMRNKVFGNSLQDAPDAWGVMKDLLDDLIAAVPESDLLRQWRAELEYFSPPTANSGGFWPVVNDISLPPNESTRSP